MGLSLAGSAGQILVSGGTGSPTWVSGSALTVGTATVATSATNIQGGSAGQLMIQADTNLTTFITAGAYGTFLRSEGAGYAPSWATADVTYGNITVPLGGNVSYLQGLANIIISNASTPSTSTTTGTFINYGGAGIGGNIYVGGNVVMTANNSSYLTIPVGNNAQRPSLGQLGMIRYNYEISSYEGFGAGASWSSLGGVKSVDGKAYISAEAFAGAGDDVLRFYSGSTGSSTQVMWASGANVSILPTTTSTSTTTGALQVAGGVGIVGNLNVGVFNNHLHHIQGNVLLGQGDPALSADSLLTINGNPETPLVSNAVVHLSATQAKSAIYGADTFSNTAASTVASYFSGRKARGTPASPSAVQADDYLTAFTGRGFGATGYTSAVSGATGMVVAANQNFTDSANGTRIDFYTIPDNSTTNSNRLSIGANGTIIVTATTASTNTTSGALIVSGGVGIAGELRVGANVTVTGNVLPSANVTYNLGSPSQRWKDLWLSGSTIYLDGASISAGPGTLTLTNDAGGSFSITGSSAGQSTGTFGNLVANSGLASTSTTTGALRITGGTGISGALNVGGASALGSTLSVTGISTLNGNVVAASGTASSSTTTGALVVVGGAGISGALYVGGGLTNSGNSAVNGGGLTTTQTTGYLFNEVATTLNVGAAATTINVGNAGGITTIAGVTKNSGNLVAASGTTSTSTTTGALVVAGGTGISGNLYTGGILVSSGNIVAAAGTASISTTTGALVVVGGVGVSGAITVGGQINSTATTAATSISTGTFVTTGGIGVAKDSYFGANVTIVGNLTVQGNNVSISSASLNVTDPLINLHSPNDLAPLTTDDGADIGLKIHYYKSGDNAAFLGWQNSTGYLEWFDSGTDTGNVFTGTTQGTIRTGRMILANARAVGGGLTANTGVLQVYGDGSISGNLYVGGTLNINNNVTFSGQQVAHDTGTLSIYDSIIDLHTYGNLAAWASDDGKDIGLRMHYYKGADTIAFLGWENTTQTLQYLQSATETNSNVSGTFGNVQFGSLTLSNATSSTNTTSGALIVSGGAGVGGELNVGGASALGSTLSVTGISTLNGNAVAASGTASSSTATGALVVVGGAGISGNTYVGGNVVMTANNSSYLTIPVGNNAQRPGLASLGMIRYNYEISSYEGYGAGGAWSSLGGVKSVDGKAYISAEASAGAGDDVLRFYSGSTGSSAQVMWASGGNVSVLPTTTSTSTTTGALQVAGGVGIAGATFIGANANIGGTLIVNTITSLSGTSGNIVIDPDGLGDVVFPSNTELFVQSTAASTSSGTGALIVSGGVGIAGAINVAGDATLVTGNIAGIQAKAIGNVTPGTGNFTSLTVNGVAVATTGGSGSFSSINSTPIGNATPSTATFTTLTSTGVTTVAGNLVANSGTASSSTTTGAAVVIGGMGVSGNINAGASINITTSAYRNSRPLTASYTGASAPSSPLAGDTWYDSSSDTVFKYLFDGTQHQWVDLSGFVVSQSSTFNSGISVTGTAALGAVTCSGITTSGPIVPSSGNAVALGSSTAWWSTVYGKSIQAQYADLAEHYKADEEYAPGTVVVFGGTNEITTTTQSHDPRTAGIISTDPAYLMNGVADGLPVALTGRVPCRVRGPVAKGDRLVTSDVAGVAERLDKLKYEPGCIIAKSLEDYDGNDITTIEVAVGRY
jgi:hypothetical protein